MKTKAQALRDRRYAIMTQQALRDLAISEYNFDKWVDDTIAFVGHAPESQNRLLENGEFYEVDYQVAYWEKDSEEMQARRDAEEALRKKKRTAKRNALRKEQAEKAKQAELAKRKAEAKEAQDRLDAGCRIRHLRETRFRDEPDYAAEHVILPKAWLQHINWSDTELIVSIYSNVCNITPMKLGNDYFEVFYIDIKSYDALWRMHDRMKKGGLRYGIPFEVLYRIIDHDNELGVGVIRSHFWNKQAYMSHISKRMEESA